MVIWWNEDFTAFIKADRVISIGIYYNPKDDNHEIACTYSTGEQEVRFVLAERDNEDDAKSLLWELAHQAGFYSPKYEESAGADVSFAINSR